MKNVWLIRAGQMAQDYIKVLEALNGDFTVIGRSMDTAKKCEDALDVLIKAGTKREHITVLHANTMYPTPMQDVNLRAMVTIGNTFDVEYGYSKHTLGIEVSVAAVAMGATVIEKHFILDKSIGGADSDFSLDKKEFSEMIRAVRDTEKFLGKVDYSMTEKNKKPRQFSRSLYVAKDIKKGETFTEENVRSVRPGYGLHPKYLKDVLGKKVTKGLEMGTPLSLGCCKII